MSNVFRSFAQPPQPDPSPSDVEYRVALLQWRLDQADKVAEQALRRYGAGPVPTDVLLDIRLALGPATLRPAVPVIPGPDGPR